MINCVSRGKEAPIELPKIGNKKPIVLSSQRFNKLLNNANQVEKLQAQKEIEEEQKYKEYLKEGSDQLVAHFKGNIQRTQDEKLAEIKANMEQKITKMQEDIHQSKENEERERSERLAKAQNLMEQLKPGPKDLHSAAMQSEVLRARNVQRNINKEFEKAIKRQECMDKLACEHQAFAFMQEDQLRQLEREQNMNTYKKEMLQTINESYKQRVEHKKQLIKEQQAIREAMDQEIKAQIEREKAIMEKKRASLRKNALEAMKMVEQRRLRERMTEEIEDRLCCVYNLGKLDMDVVKKEEEAKKLIYGEEKKQEMQAQFFRCIQAKTDAAEDERVRRDISRMQLKFTAEEQEKIRKDKAAKQARIEAYMRELQQQKEVKRRAEEEKRYDMATRFKNCEVNRLFEEAQQQKRLTQIKETRASLKEQLELKKRVENEDKELMRPTCEDNKEEREDKYFFEYARNLMEDAHKKDRPLYPFVKVVQQYKRERGIDCERKTPRHLVTQVNIGTRPPIECKTNVDHLSATLVNKPKPTQLKAAHDSSTEAMHISKSVPIGKETLAMGKMERSAKDSILENCLKISELIAADAKKTGNDDKEKCDNRLVDCLKPSNRMAQLKKDDDCESLLNSGKVRYSLGELKKMNQFPSTKEQ
ncbi:calponin homology domain-containing protein DDB_G0272472-like [Anastrepha ludens]|uniref:calponin homology domain-containing protein DDB_G0272472-like n=1 Tax=Anastrepha ludens TaxID=28586 RepID=UPI0023AF35A4|nr:calponin homology domain-containing protein DDB_G0272472-like [Anastrepha ludens]